MVNLSGRGDKDLGIFQSAGILLMPSQPYNSHCRPISRSASEQRQGLMVYLTAGDPNLDATGELLVALDRAGVDVIELGVPFSDPLADGPVIQRASERALRAGTTLRKILERFPPGAKSVQAPIILFSYFNPILQYGLENFAASAAASGRGWRAGGGLDRGRGGRLRPGHAGAESGHGFSGFAHLHGRAPETCGATFHRLPLSDLAHRRHRGTQRDGFQRARCWPSARAGSPPCRSPWDLASPPRRRCAKSSRTPMPPWWAAPWCTPLKSALPRRGRRQLRSLYGGLKPGRRINPHERYGGLAQAHRRD